MNRNINEIVATTFTTIERINKEWWRHWWDALLLYFEYIKKSRIDETNQPRATDTYMQKWLERWKDRFYNAKKVLQWLWLIETINRKDEKWLFWKTYIRVNYIINDETKLIINGTTENQESGETETNALSNKLNALNNKENTNSFPKQNDSITQNITNGNLTYTIDDIWNAYPSIPKRKWTKQNAEKSLAKKTDEEKKAMIFDMQILKLEYRYKIEDISRWLTCSHWIDNYTIQDETEIDNRLKRIIAYHMSNTEDKEKMKKRYNDICELFWEDKVKAFVKAYGREKNKITLNIN